MVHHEYDITDRPSKDTLGPAWDYPELDDGELVYQVELPDEQDWRVVERRGRVLRVLRRQSVAQPESDGTDT